MESKALGAPQSYLDGYPVVNNMVIRQLLGRERFMDTRPVDENDLERAKIQLDACDAFVPLEYLQHESVLQLLNRTIPEYFRGIMLNRLLPMQASIPAAILI